MALAGRNANIKITSSTSITDTGQPATLAADGYSVQVDNSSVQHWDPASTGYPILYLNSTAVPAANYAVNYVQGKFVFGSTQSTGTYTADVDYLTASALGGGREWSVNLDSDMFEVSEFQSSGWRQYMPNLSGGTVSIGRYWEDSTFYDLLNTESKFLLELIVNQSGGWKYEAFGYVTSDQVGAAVDGIVGESVEFTIDGPVYFTT